MQIPILDSNGKLKMMTLGYGEYGVLSIDALTALFKGYYEKQLEGLEEVSKDTRKRLTTLAAINADCILDISNYRLRPSRHGNGRCFLGAIRENQQTEDENIEVGKDFLGKPFDFWFAGERLNKIEHDEMAIGRKDAAERNRVERESLKTYTYIEALRMDKPFGSMGRYQTSIGYMLEDSSDKTALIPIINDTVGIRMIEVKPGERTILSNKALSIYVNKALNGIDINSMEYGKRHEILNKISVQLGLDWGNGIRQTKGGSYVLGSKGQTRTIDTDSMLLNHTFSYWFGEDKVNEDANRSPYAVYITEILVQDGKRVAFNVRNARQDIQLGNQMFKSRSCAVLNKEQMLMLYNTGIEFLNATVYKNSLGTIVVKALPGKRIREVRR